MNALVPAKQGTTAGALIVAALAAGVLSAAVYQAVAVYQFGQLDFLQYWAAARAVAGASSPYNPATLAAIQREVCGVYCDEIPVLLWNPPIIIPLITPFGLFPFLTAAVLWNLMNFCALIAALVLVAQHLRLPAAARRLFMVFALVHYPIALNLYYGQSSPLILLGLALFLVCATDSRRPGRLFAGLGLVITALKPHLLFLLYTLLLGGLLKGRKFSVAAAAGVAGTGLLILAILLRGPLLHEYLESLLNAPPLYWKTPTLGSFLQEATGSPRWRIVPALCAALCAVVWTVRRRAEVPPDSWYVVLPFSLVLSPYGWTYDQMLLLPAVAWAFARAHSFSDRRIMLLISGILFLLNVGLLFPIGGSGQEMTIWYPALLGVLCAGLVLRTSRETPCA